MSLRTRATTPRILAGATLAMLLGCSDASFFGPGPLGPVYTLHVYKGQELPALDTLIVSGNKVPTMIVAGEVLVRGDGYTFLALKRALDSAGTTISLVTTDTGVLFEGNYLHQFGWCPGNCHIIFGCPTINCPQPDSVIVALFDAWRFDVPRTIGIPVTTFTAGTEDSLSIGGSFGTTKIDTITQREYHFTRRN